MRRQPTKLIFRDSTNFLSDGQKEEDKELKKAKKSNRKEGHIVNQNSTYWPIIVKAPVQLPNCRFEAQLLVQFCKINDMEIGRSELMK